MGFFGELKQDLSQAVNELLPADEPITESTGQEEMSLGEMLENIDDIKVDESNAGNILERAEAVSDMPGENTGEDRTEDAVNEELLDSILNSDVLDNIAEDIPVSEIKQEVEDDSLDLESMLNDVLAAEETKQETVHEGAVHTENKQVKNEDMSVAPETPVKESKGDKKIMDAFAGTREASEETSVITVGMSITGDISSEGSLDIIGNVTGNIDILGKLNVTGHVNGNSKASEIFADGAKINGEIVSEGAVKVGASTVIIGNITATSAAIAGAVKGDIDVKGPVVLDASAIVMGNIKSKSVQINNGAVIEGMCSQCYADVSPTSFFEDYKPEIKKVKTSK